jgi:RNA polymerase sigma factor (sigma-70 family)
MEAVLVNRLEQTYKEERQNLLGFIKSKINDAEEAEDLLQDVFYQAARNMDATEPIDNLLGWLYTVARNKIIDWYRRKSKTVSMDGADETTSLEALIRDSGIDIETQFIRNMVAEALIESVEELPENQREVFIMQAIEGHTFREISELTNTSINTLIARKRYALQFLRKRLKDIKEVLDESG